MLAPVNSPFDALQSARRRRFWLAGIPVDVLGESELITLFEQCVLAAKRIVIANVNLHGLYTALRSREMLALLNAPNTIVHIDGTPVLWVAKLFIKAIPDKARNAHIDLLPKMLKVCAARQWPVVIVGSDAAGASENEKALTRLVPGLRITAFDGHFSLSERAADSKQASIVARIRLIEPALLLVGMGMPRQEHWIGAIRDELDVPVIMPVGGFADYFAGRTRTPPRFLGRLGLEWGYRLVQEPRRLGFRYLVEPFLLLFELLMASLNGAKWGRDRGREPNSYRSAEQ